MICKLVFNLTCDRFSVQIVCSSYEDPNVGLEPGCLASRLASCLVVCTTADVDLEGVEYELFFKVLIRHFLCSWQSAKTAGGGSFWPPSSGGVFVPDHPHCHSTALVAFSLL